MSTGQPGDEDATLPDGWCWTTAAELVDESRGITYGVVKLGDPVSGGVPVLRSSNVRHLRLELTEVKAISQAIADAYRRTCLQGGEVLVTVRGTLGGVVAVPTSCRGFNVSREVAVIPFAKGSDPRLLAFLIGSPQSQAWLRKNTRGVAYSGVNIEDLKRLPLPLPPAQEQLRIGATLDALRAGIDRATVELHPIQGLIDRLRQSILAAAFRGDLTADWRKSNSCSAVDLSKDKETGATGKNKKREAEQSPRNPVPDRPAVPETWTWAPASEIVAPGAEIMYGIIQPGPHVGDGVPYVRGKDIQDGEILVHQLLRTSPEIAKDYERASLRGGDVLLGIIRATKVAIVPEALEGGNITQGTARFRPSKLVLTSFLAGALESPFSQAWLHAHYRGIDMPGLNLRDVRRLPIPVAPLSEQREVCRRLTEWDRRLRSLRRECSAALDAIEHLGQSILAKAFRGELVPQDPNEEPASVLLERIRAEREKNGSGKKGRKAKLAVEEQEPDEATA